MFRTLLKKELFELVSFFLRDKKTGKIKSGKTAVGILLLYVWIFLTMSLSLAGLTASLGKALANTDYDWIYFSITSVYSILFSVFLNALSTYSILYVSKDNEFLLSLPIPTKTIIAARMTSVYISGIFYEAVVLLPALVIYSLNSPLDLIKILSFIILFVICSILIVSLSSIFGFLVSKVMVKIKKSSFVTFLFSLAFIGFVYFSQFKFTELYHFVADNPDKTASFITEKFYPLYVIGHAFTGNILFTVITGITALIILFAVLLILKKTFIKIVTTNSGNKKKVKTNFSFKNSTLQNSLLKKEFKRYFTCPIYMLNSGFGLIILIIGSIFLLVFSNEVNERISSMTAGLLPDANILTAILPYSVCLILSMNTISAPSISLEGKSFYLIQSLPIAPYDFFMAKIRLHICLEFFPTIIGTLCIAYVFKLSLLLTISSLLYSILFVIFTAYLGLIFNAKKTDLEWRNETVPIKQGISVLMTMITGFVTNIIFIMLSLILHFSALPDSLNNMLPVILMLMIDLILVKYLQKNSVKLFNKI